MFAHAKNYDFLMSAFLTFGIMFALFNYEYDIRNHPESLDVNKYPSASFNPRVDNLVCQLCRLVILVTTCLALLCYNIKENYRREWNKRWNSGHSHNPFAIPFIHKEHEDEVELGDEFNFMDFSDLKWTKTMIL